MCGWVGSVGVWVGVGVFGWVCVGVGGCWWVCVLAPTSHPVTRHSADNFFFASIIKHLLTPFWLFPAMPALMTTTNINSIVFGE